jgi:aspartate/methionine/tyrosine aminotransferase
VLHEEQVSVVPGRFFQSPNHFRLAFGLASPETLRGGLEGMRRVLDRMRG